MMKKMKKMKIELNQLVGIEDINKYSDMKFRSVY